MTRRLDPTLENLLAELLAGRTDSQFAMPTGFNDGIRYDSLCHLCACELYAGHPSPLDDLLTYVAQKARDGDAVARTLVLTLAARISDAAGVDDEIEAEKEAERVAEYEARHPYIAPANVRSL